MREAAALPQIVITAWEWLVDGTRIDASQTVLVQGGAGGVGHVAIQLAQAFGAVAYATASTRGGVYIETLGATPISRETGAEAQAADLRKAADLTLSNTNLL